MSVTVNGRPRYFGTDTHSTISISRRRGDDPFLVIKGGYIEQRPDGFVIASKHPSATDREHDSAYVALLEGAGLEWDGMLGMRHTFKGAIFKARLYVNDPQPEDVEHCDICKEVHGELDFTPPKQKWDPALYWIEISHRPETDEES